MSVTVVRETEGARNGKHPAGNGDNERSGDYQRKSVGRGLGVESVGLAS